MATPDLPRVLADAALQSHFMAPRRHDLAREREGAKFVYGIDASVVPFWGNPMADEADGDPYVGRIFSHDPADLATAIGLGLLNHVFNYLGDTKPPLLIVPPIEREITGILQALQQTDHSSASSRVAARVGEIVERLRGELTPERLGTLNIKLHEIIFDEIGEDVELRRILLLFAQRRLLKLEDAGSLLKMRDPLLADTLLPSENVLHRWFEYGARKNGEGLDPGWYRRLKDAAPARGDTNLKSDAEVLARLEVWNRILAREGSDHRFLYITADLSIFRAAAGVDASWDTEGKSATFAEAFLRHPRAFLAEDGVLGRVDDVALRDQEARAETVGEWLKLLTEPADASFAELLDAARNRRGPPPSIEAFAAKMSQPHAHGRTAEDLAQGLLQKWDHFAKGALAARDDPREAFLGLTKDYSKPADTVFQMLRDAHEGLEGRRAETLRQYINVTTQLSQKIEAGQEKQPLLSSIAPIFFEGWSEANEAIAAMSGWSDERIEEAVYQDAVDLISRDDSSSYAFYLGNAAFFAARGRWKSAAMLSRRARGIHDENGANGREAAYFEGFCQRRLARSPHELAGASECLATAVAILAEERQAGRYLEFAEERFTFEAATIDLAHHLFSLAPDRRAPIDAAPLEASASEFREQLEVHWTRMGVADDPARFRAGPPPRVGDADVRPTRLRVEAQLLTRTILFAFLPHSSPTMSADARRALGVLESRLLEGHILESALSCFDRAFLFAARLREHGAKSTRAMQRAFDAEIGKLTAERAHLLPYELPLIESVQRLSKVDWLGR